MNLRNIMLSELSQTWRSLYCMILFKWNSRKGMIIVATCSLVAWNLGSRRGSDAKSSRKVFRVRNRLSILIWCCLHGSIQLLIALNCPLKIGEFYYLQIMLWATKKREKWNDFIFDTCYKFPRIVHVLWKNVLCGLFQIKKGWKKYI